MSLLEDMHQRHKQFHANIARRANELKAKTAPPPRKTTEPIKSAPIVTAHTVEEWVERQKQIHPRIWFSIIDEIDPQKLTVIPVGIIQKITARFYNQTVTSLLSERKSAPIVRARQVAMFLTKELTGKSLPDIGRRFGGRDHTTALHSIRKIERLRAIDPHLDEDLKTLASEIRGALA